MPAEAYRRIFESRTPEEIRELAQVKRFLERLIGDDRFRTRLNECADDARPAAAEIGVDVDPNLMKPLWHAHHRHQRWEDGDPAFPVAMRWDAYIREMLDHVQRLREYSTTDGVNPIFDAWRERQVLRANSECGSSAHSITHPLVAYELSEGCSVGCWFCGISAEKFRGAWPHTPANTRLWRAVLEVMVQRFGKAARSGFCYWATDPMDNPDYPDFIQDHFEVTGYLPQTTTAAPLRDVALTRRVLDLFERHRCITNRFSILTRKTLEQVHQTFGAEDLMGVEMVLQNKEALTSKAVAGRARERQSRLRAQGRSDKLALVEADHQTIACVSGLLVSMPRGTVQLVTPTRPSERWPKGYKVLGERRFDSRESFDDAVCGLIEREARNEVEGDQPLRLRPDLRYEPTEEGFALRSGSVLHRCEGSSTAARIGELVSRGDDTFGTAIARLAGEGENVLLATSLLGDLYRSGVLLEPADLRPAPSPPPTAPGTGTAPAPAPA